MVKVTYKFHSHGKRGKWHSQEVRTYREAQELKKSLSPKDKVFIESRGRVFTDKELKAKRSLRPRKQNSLNFGFNMPRQRKQSNPFGWF